MQNFIEYHCSSAITALSVERCIQLLLFREMTSYYSQPCYIGKDKSVQKRHMQFDQILMSELQFFISLPRNR